ncbi:uncharacterized protein LOC143153338 [Ptiloglossa arizonensis]|uniref:uncharacterized protein LOC143153338 n=1 Tax=Ptiloglossa arizonensis TaxID=3350558 RepID=UPI003F9F9A35
MLQPAPYTRRERLWRRDDDERWTAGCGTTASLQRRMQSRTRIRAFLASLFNHFPLSHPLYKRVSPLSPSLYSLVNALAATCVQTPNRPRYDSRCGNQFLCVGSQRVNDVIYSPHPSTKVSNSTPAASTTIRNDDTRVERRYLHTYIRVTRTNARGRFESISSRESGKRSKST